MCGIVGVLGGDITRGALEHVVEQMSQAVAHRGPDGDGLWSDPVSPACFAQRRLAIVDLSEAGRQPMVSASGRWVVVFNGEVYNHRDLRSALGEAGVRYDGHSDTRALVEAVDLWGFEATLRRANGMFAIAAWDTERRQLLVARDRLGEKPLYWQLQSGRFAFASELRGVLAGSQGSPSLDDRAMASLLHWSFIPHPFTAREGVRQLAPGGLLEVDLRGAQASVVERSWWSLADTVDDAIDQRRPNTLDRAADELHELLTDAVRIRLEADVPLGAFLSGGIDSSVIAAIAQRELGGSLKTFTVRMPDGSFDESEHAAKVARHLGTDHVVADLSVRDALDLIPTLADVYDEPFADPSMLPMTLLCRAAHGHLTVCLGGDGGDEMFAGYNRHVFGASIDRRAGRLPRSVRQVLGRAMMAPSPATIDKVFDFVGRGLPAKRRLPNLGDKVQKAGALVQALDPWETLAQIWPIEMLSFKPYQPFKTSTRHDLELVERMVLADTASVLPDQMLVKVDRASMSAPIEVRVPLLDHRILEWSWRQPPELKTSGGVGKLVLRRLASRLLPDEIVNRPKMGFDPPMGDWLRDDLAGWAGQQIETVSRLNWVQAPDAIRTWSEHRSGRRNWDYRIWALLSLPLKTVVDT